MKTWKGVGWSLSSAVLCIQTQLGAASGMHPQNPASFNHRRELLDTGRTYHFVDQLPPNYQLSTPTLLCVHGFPDLWYGWRYQIGPWSSKFRVIIPDMLGYGSTDKPLAPSEYSTRMLSDDLAALLDLVGVEKAVCVLFRPLVSTLRLSLSGPYRT